MNGHWMVNELGVIIMRSLIRSRELVADKPGHSVEREVAELFKKLCWAIRLTPSTGDLGEDVVAHCLDEITVVQCKDWTANVGYDAVKEVVSARVRYKAKIAVVVSNAGYTKQARDNPL